MMTVRTTRSNRRQRSSIAIVADVVRLSSADSIGERDTVSTEETMAPNVRCSYRRTTPTLRCRQKDNDIDRLTNDPLYTSNSSRYIGRLNILALQILSTLSLRQTRIKHPASKSVRAGPSTVCSLSGRKGRRTLPRLRLRLRLRLRPTREVIGGRGVSLSSRSNRNAGPRNAATGSNEHRGTARTNIRL